MSRTYRRRNAKYNLGWVLHKFNRRFGFQQLHRLDPKMPAGKKALAHYYSDAGFGDYAHATPPHWYRRHLNHRADRREEQELHRWRRDPAREVVLPRRVRNASCYW